ncbi:autotransporter outer membrane beta-barrel domain-containing protein [Nitratireductor basaltis]|uniref:Autotransporter domain-containing protein n=1 Tax=Nitratireductor basaltis TaxID=472175 RepID=A0A084U957_9HYPH|nr:autotransporter outer membrane beta-barrel domain-containing protein [Nitratireductor basaltis]KFB09493.1 hypothetical protein EL18_00509 [Nitratireductor basaltis]
MDARRLKYVVPCMLAVTAVYGGDEAQAACSWTDGVAILCDQVSLHSPFDTIVLNGASHDIKSGTTYGGSSGADLAGVGSTATYSGIIDAGRNNDLLELTDVTILGESNPYSGGIAIEQPQNGSIFGGAGRDTIILNRVTTSGNVVGDAAGSAFPDGIGNDDIFVITDSNIGGTIMMGNASPNDDDEVTINGSSVIAGGIGARLLERGNDTITINNGTIGANGAGESVFAGAENDKLGIFGGTIQNAINMAGDDDILVINPGGAEAAEWTYSTPSGETTSLTFQNTEFKGGGGNDDAFVYGAGAGVFAANTVWDSWRKVVLNNSRIDLADSSVDDIHLENNSMLVQHDGFVALRSQAGGAYPSALHVDGTSRVDLQDGAADDVIQVGTFRPSAGTVLAVDVDTSAAGYAPDDSDHIRNTAAPDHVYALGALVDVNLLGTPALSGARRIVDDKSSTGLNADPGVNATPDSSTNYLLVSDPSTAARSFWLQDEGSGGVYLLWTTNINETTTSGYIGGSATPGEDPGEAGRGFAALSASGPQAVSDIVGDLASGTPAVAISVATRAEPVVTSEEAALEPEVLYADGQGMSGQCAFGHRYSVWSSISGDRGEYGSADVDTLTGSLGAEADLGDMMGLGCNRAVLGGFLYTSAGDLTQPDATALQMNNWGGGAYLRGSTAQGFYGSILGHAGRGDVDVVNGVMAATASFEGTSYGVAANLGIKRPIAAATAIDLRGYAGWTRFDAEPFADSMGLTIDDISSETLVLGAHIGVEHSFTEQTTGVARLGVKWTDVESSIASSGAVSGFDSDYLVATGEVGMSGRLGSNIDVSVTAFGEVGNDIHRVGGRARLTLSF